MGGLRRDRSDSCGWASRSSSSSRRHLRLSSGRRVALAASSSSVGSIGLALLGLWSASVACGFGRRRPLSRLLGACGRIAFGTRVFGSKPSSSSSTLRGMKAGAAFGTSMYSKWKRATLLPSFRNAWRFIQTGDFRVHHQGFDLPVNGEVPARAGAIEVRLLHALDLDFADGIGDPLGCFRLRRLQEDLGGGLGQHHLGHVAVDRLPTAPSPGNPRTMRVLAFRFSVMAVWS